MTTYKVLRATPTEGAAGPHYEAKGQIEAHGSLAALRKAGEQWGAGIYVAIPESNWSEENVGVETTTRITVGHPSRTEQAA